MREKTVTFNAYNMKPNTVVHVFLDNINVNQYCNYAGVTGGPFTTSTATGSLIGVSLSIPSGMFETGEKILRIVDDANNDIGNATTIAEGVFYANGSKSENPLQVSSVRQADIRKQTPNSNKVVSTPLYRKKNLNTTKYNQWIDPLAQTFEVNEDIYPNGFFGESVDLFIATADTELPISVEICPVINGLPQTSVVLPFSTVVKNPSELNVSATTPTATTFKFSSPVFFSTGQYAVLVRTNSSRYSVFAATVGDKDLVTEEKITSTLSSGSLFRTQNNSEVTGDNNTDLMFKLYRCQFSTSTTNRTVVLDFVHDGTDIVAGVVQPNLFSFTPGNISLSTSLVLGATTYQVTNGRNVFLGSELNINSGQTVEMNVSASNTSNGMNTFMIDMDRTNIVAVEYIINSSEASTTVEQAPVSGRNDDTARYISRYVTIPSGLSAKELKVYIDANYPSGTFIRVYAKTFNSIQSSSEVDLYPYKRMAIEPTSEFYTGGKFTNSVNPHDFREASYSVVPSEPFNTFLVKICLYTEDKAKTPVVKNLRIVAIE